MLNEKNLRQAFQAIDSNRDGMIDCQELENAYKAHGGLKTIESDKALIWSNFIGSVDLNDSVKINFEEFKNIMRLRMSKTSSIE